MKVGREGYLTRLNEAGKSEQRQISKITVRRKPGLEQVEAN